MESKVVRAYLLNAETAADSVLTAGVVQVTGWFPIKQTEVISAIKISSQAEVRQVVTIVSAAAIVAFTKYQVAIGNTGNRREGAQNQLTFFGATAPAVLSGNAATDKHNIYMSIAAKINNTGSARANAGANITITHAATVGVFVLNEVVVGATSGAKGYLVLDSAGTLTIANFFGSFANGETITGATSGATALTTAGPTLGLGLRIIDIGQYFSAYTKGLFQGPNTVLVTKGFAASDLTITTAGVIGRGIGSRLVDDVPVKELLSDNLNKGLFSFPTLEAVVSTNNYTEYIVIDSIKAPNDAMSGTTVGAQRVQVIYVNEGAASFAAFNTAMVTNFPTMVDASGVAIGAGASAYTLGISAGFAALFGGTFTVSNAGLVVGTGNVTASSNVNAGNTTFGSGAFIVGPTAAQQAVVLALYNQLKALAATNVVDLSTGNLTATNIGFGLGVFVPGVYKSTAAVSAVAAKTITLSGDGDYVFNIAGALTFGATDNIVLTNGAKASRVYFVVGTVTAGSSMTTGATDNLKGTFILGNGGVATTLGATNTIEGRIMSTGAEVTVIDGTASSIYLPVA